MKKKSFKFLKNLIFIYLFIYFQWRSSAPKSGGGGGHKLFSRKVKSKKKKKKGHSGV